MKTRLRIPTKKSFRSIGAVLAVTIVAISGYTLTQNALAATAVLLPNSDVTTGWAECNAGTCGSARYTYIDEDIASPTDSDYIGTGSAGASAADAAVEFGLTTTANVDTVSSIQVGVRARIQTVGGSTEDTISINLRIGGNLQTATTVTPSTTAYGNHTVTFNGSWTQSDLDGAQVLVTRNTLGSGNPTNQRDDVRISAISATVTYTQTITFDQSSYRWFEEPADGAITFARSWGGTNTEVTQAVVVDDAGNIYVAGGSLSTGLTSGYYDHTLVKYNSGGGEEWVKTWGGSSGADTVGAMAIDDQGNIFVAGITGSSGITSGANDQVLIKYDTDGIEQFSVTWGGTGFDSAMAIALDSQGNIFVAGTTDSTELTSGSIDQTLVKYNASGVEQWSKTWGDTGDDTASGIAIDTAGNIYVVGSTSSSGIMIGASSQTLVKYNSSGVEQWSTVWGDDGIDDSANGVAVTVDSAGNIYTAGFFYSVGAGLGGSDQYIAKYNSSGVEQWSKTWGGASTDTVNDLTLDSEGNIYTAGSTLSAGLTAGNYDQTVVKYNSSGVEQWSRTYGGTASDSAKAIVVGQNDMLYVAGEVSSSGFTAGVADQSLLALGTDGSIDNCSECVTRSVTETDITADTVEAFRTMSEVDITGDATIVSHDLSEVDRTGVATTTIVCVPGVDVGTPLAAINTAANAPAEGVPFRLRMTVHVNTAQADPASADFKLQYAQRGADNVCDTSFTNETYADLSPSSGAIRYYNNPNAADGQALAANANDPTHSTDDVVLQTYEESNNFTIANAIPAGDDGLWDFSIVNHSAPVGTSYCFRAVDSSGTVLNSYAQIPQIDIPLPEVSQANYRWYENADSASPGAPLAAQDTSTTIATETPFRLRQLLGVSLSPLEGYRVYGLEFAEKVTTCSAATYAPITQTVEGDLSQSNFPAAAENDTSSGSLAWTSPLNARYSDGSSAGAGVGWGVPKTSTNYLKLTDYSFNIPATATVTGIEVKIEGTSQNYNFGQYPQPLFVSLLKDGDRTAATSNITGSFPSQIVVLGNPADLWNNTWTPEEINSTGFGVSFSSTLDDEEFISIDSVEIVVHYSDENSVAPGILAFDNPGVAVTAGLGSASNPVPSSGQIVDQLYTEDATVPFLSSISAGDSGLWDFALTSTAEASGKSYCFRVVDDNGDPLGGGYDYYPEITFSSGGGNGPDDPPTLDQSTRGGGGVVNGVKKNLSWRND